MNLRKKKKRLKKQVESMRAELDSMLKKPAPVVVERPEIKTLVNINYYDLDEYEDRSLLDMYGETACIFSEVMRDYMLFKDELITIGHCPMMKITAKLRVVVPDGGDGF